MYYQCYCNYVFDPQLVNELVDCRLGNPPRQDVVHSVTICIEVTNHRQLLVHVAAWRSHMIERKVPKSCWDDSRKCQHERRVTTQTKTMATRWTQLCSSQRPKWPTTTVGSMADHEKNMAKKKRVWMFECIHLLTQHNANNNSGRLNQTNLYNGTNRRYPEVYSHFSQIPWLLITDACTHTNPSKPTQIHVNPRKPTQTHTRTHTHTHTHTHTRAHTHTHTTECTPDTWHYTSLSTQIWQKQLLQRSKYISWRLYTDNVRDTSTHFTNTMVLDYWSHIHDTAECLATNHVTQHHQHGLG